MIAPTKADKNSTSNNFYDDRTSPASTSVDFSSNNINEDYLMEPIINKTLFRSLNNSIIVSQVGSIAQIPCRVHLIGDEMVKSCSSIIALIIQLFRFLLQVSWIRRKDYHLLTVGLTTYSSDERFSIIHYEETEVNERAAQL